MQKYNKPNNRSTYKPNNKKKRYPSKKPRENNIEGLTITSTECNGDMERMIKKFKKKVMKSGLMIELKSRQAYEKPSDKRRRRKKESIRRCRKEELKIKALNKDDDWRSSNESN